MSGPRCAYCRDSFAEVPSLACAGCGALLHPECWREAKRCPSIGCELPAPEAAEAEAPAPRAPSSAKPALSEGSAARERLPATYPALGAEFRGLARVSLGLVAIVPCGITWLIPLLEEVDLGRTASIACGLAGLVAVLHALYHLGRGARELSEDRRLRREVQARAGSQISWATVFWGPREAPERNAPVFHRRLLLFALLATAFLIPLHWEPSFREGPRPLLNAILLLDLPLSSLWALTAWLAWRARSRGPHGRVRYEAPLLRGSVAALEVELPARLRDLERVRWSLRWIQRVGTPGSDLEGRPITVVRHDARELARGEETPREGGILVRCYLPEDEPATELPVEPGGFVKGDEGTFWELWVEDPAAEPPGEEPGESWADEGRAALYPLPVY